MSTHEAPLPRAPLELSGRILWIGFAAAAVGAFMNNLDATIVNVILPILSHRFLVPVTTLQWVASAYLLVITAVLPTLTRLADGFGRREVFALGLLAFVVGSALCAVAPSFALLVAARGFQGLGGAVIMGNVSTIIALIFPKERRGQALGWTAAVIAIGTLMGPPLGGLLSAVWGWRSVFWINIPFGLWALWGIRVSFPRFPRVRAELEAFDTQGSILYALTVTVFEIGLVNLHHLWGWGAVMAAAIGVVAFIRREKAAPTPLIPLRLFRRSDLVRGLASGWLYWIVMMFPGFLTPLYLHARGVSVPAIGIIMMAQAVFMVIAGPIGGWMGDRWGGRLPAQLGLAALGLGALGFGFAGLAAPLWEVVGLLALMGIAAGLFSSPGVTMVLNAVAHQDISHASVLAAIQRALGRAMGVALASLSLSVTWMLLGIGPVLGLGHAGYSHWLLLGIQNVFRVGAVLTVVALLALPVPANAHRGGSVGG